MVPDTLLQVPEMADTPPAYGYCSFLEKENFYGNKFRCF